MKTADVAYTDGPVNMLGFLAYDETLSGKRPGILVVHEAFGLGEHAMERAKMLAGLGYVAFAADMFGGRKQAKTMEEIGALMGDLRASPAKLRTRARSALDTLAKQPQVDASSLGGIGFCFGGTTVLELARDGTPNVRGVVSFHGSLQTAAPAEPGKVKASILVCHGADDAFVPPEQVTAFEQEMRNAKADWQLISYGNTVHSFTNPAADGSFSPSVLYNKKTDERSWKTMRSFFEESFGRA